MAVGALLSSTLLSQSLTPDDYDERAVMIPMRDGVELYTELYTPRKFGTPRAIVFVRTPYRVADPRGGSRATSAARSACSASALCLCGAGCPQN
ncbi:MAG: hypothetical protein NXI31_12355 [bacterium]|nr:hypothetical protein [bacterium]